MQVNEGMSTVVLTIGPGLTLREAARQMAGRHVGAAVVIDPDSPGPGILTERDILQAVAAGQDCDREIAPRPDGERLTSPGIDSGSPAPVSTKTRQSFKWPQHSAISITDCSTTQTWSPRSCSLKPSPATCVCYRSWLGEQVTRRSG